MCDFAAEGERNSKNVSDIGMANYKLSSGNPVCFMASLSGRIKRTL
jgi:hypothetical protein